MISRADTQNVSPGSLVTTGFFKQPVTAPGNKYHKSIQIQPCKPEGGELQGYSMSVNFITLRHRPAAMQLQIPIVSVRAAGREIPDDK